MKQPDPCEPLKKLVDRLNEQLEALCSQNQEHFFLEELIDLRGLTEATRAMLKDAEKKLENCSQHLAPPTNRPFLVTFIEPNCPRGVTETHQSQVRTPLWERVAVCAGVGVLGLSLGFALHEYRLTQSLAPQNERELASLNATRSQIDGLKAKVQTLEAQRELSLVPAEDTNFVDRSAGPGQPIQDEYVKRLRAQTGGHGRAIGAIRRYLPAAHGDFATTHAEQTGSVSRTHDEMASTQRSGERDYYEFDIDKSELFQRNGTLGIRLKKANTKHQYADLELLIDDRELSQQHVNLYQVVTFYMPDSPEPASLVINSISRNHIHGYVSKQEDRQSELASMSNIPTAADANQTSTNADARVRPAQDRGQVGLQRAYGFCRATVAHETHRISVATLPIRNVLRRRLSNN